MRVGSTMTVTVEDDEVGVHLLFTGRVQGVFFRANTRQQAMSLGLKGWVRNLPDGRVEAWVEGGRADVGRLIEFCQTGIPHALVDMVDMEEGSPTGDYQSFEVRR